MAGYMRVNTDVVLSSQSRENVTFGGFAYGADAGAAYFVSSNVSFDFVLTYERGKLSGIEDNKFGAKVNGLGASIGISVYF